MSPDRSRPLACETPPRSTWQRCKPQVLAILVGVIAVSAVGGILAEAGNSLPTPRSQQIFRFCNGKCLCDGGAASAGLMERICPEGWQEVYSSTRNKVIRREREKRRQRIIRMQKSTPPPPPPPQWPSV